MIRLSAFLLCAVIPAAVIPAQQGPPAEPPLPMPSAHGQALEVTTREVLVPTLVEKPHGGIVYGLKQGDFLVEDDGVRQKVRLQEEMDTAPVALVVAVEQGAMSVLEFDKFQRLGPLLEMFLTDNRAQAALVGFDSAPHLLVDFTHDGEEVSRGLRDLRPGDGGAAILDTVSYAIDLLQSEPKEYRRVLLLISEERDHGSKSIKPAALVRRIGQSEILVLSISFSPARAEFLHDVQDSGDNRTMSIISSLWMAVQAVKKNVARELAVMSGGEYTTFTGDRGFEKRVLEAAKRTRNRYLITFSPSNPTPGLHTLKVKLTADYGAKVTARASYWIDQTPPE